MKDLLSLTIAACFLGISCDDADKKPPKEPTPAKDSAITGDIKVVDGYPKSSALTTKRKEDDKEVEVPIASVNATWAVEAPCPCDKLKIRQEIKGYIEVLGHDGTKTTLSAKDIVEKTMSRGGVPDKEGTEAYDVRHPSSGKDDSKTEFIHDIGTDGSSTYPGKQIQCKKLDDKKSQVEFVDQPGTDAVVGEKGKLYKEYNIRLTFRSIILCDNKEIGSLVWHIKFDLPETADHPKEVALGELK